MKHLATAAGLVALSAGAASAGGIDRSGQGIGILFEKGRVVELSFGSVSPSVSGNDVAAFGGGPSGQVADNYVQFSLSYKQDLNDKLSLALIMDQPFGADILYGPGSVALGGTRAYAETIATTALLRYKFTENFSVHGGIRAQRASGEIDLRGLAYGLLNGYSVQLDNDIGFGYSVGVAYERPEIALRVALTYNSKVKHEFDTVQNIIPISPTVTEVETPQSVNLDFQSGIAKDTLIFGQIRWVDWSAFKIDPPGFPSDGLVDLDDTTTYTIGVGRRFNENWSGSISFTHEPATGDDLVSPLAPTNGRNGVTLAAVYTKDNMKITTGINYTEVGDAMPETGTNPDVARADFRDNTSVGIGVRVAFTF
ncbi:MAG: OmpP1/FadL family transporter [Gemmobacter sp.]